MQLKYREMRAKNSSAKKRKRSELDDSSFLNQPLSKRLCSLAEIEIILDEGSNEKKGLKEMKLGEAGALSQTQRRLLAELRWQDFGFRSTGFYGKDQSKSSSGKESSSLVVGSLYQAASSGDLDAVRLLFETHRGVFSSERRYLNDETQRNEGAALEFPTSAAASSPSPLMVAAANGRLEVVAYLLEQAGAGRENGSSSFYLGIDSVNEKGVSALHRAVCGGHSGIVALLLSKGANANLKDSLKRTPLHWAASLGFIDCVRLLLPHSVDLWAEDCSGRSPSELASLNRHSSVVDLLESTMDLEKDDPLLSSRRILS